MEFLLQLVVTGIISCLITRLFILRGVEFGTLVIDFTNPEKEVYQIQLDNLDDLPKKKRIVLSVKSQK